MSYNVWILIKIQINSFDIPELEEAHEGEEVLFGLEYHRNDTERSRQASAFGWDPHFHRITS